MDHCNHTKCSYLHTPVSPTEGHQGAIAIPKVHCSQTHRNCLLPQMEMKLDKGRVHRDSCHDGSHGPLTVQLQMSRCAFESFHWWLTDPKHEHHSDWSDQYSGNLGILQLQCTGILKFFHRPCCRVPRMLERWIKSSHNCQYVNGCTYVCVELTTVSAPDDRYCSNPSCWYGLLSSILQWCRHS